MPDPIDHSRRRLGAGLALGGAALGGTALGGTALGGAALLPAAPAQAADPGLVTRRSAHGVADTIARFRAAVTAAGWVVFTEIDHAAAAAAVGMTLAPRTVVCDGNPKAGTPAMQAHPTLAIDLPMRVLVWQDESGSVFVTRSSAGDLATRVYARHGIDRPAGAQESMEAFFGNLVTAATA
jgi:uncharacterized protein (DUF302 family)